MALNVQDGTSKVGSMTLNVQDGLAIIDYRIKGIETISICLVRLLRLYPIENDVLLIRELILQEFVRRGANMDKVYTGREIGNGQGSDAGGNSSF
jgi:hypothetical protein